MIEWQKEQQKGSTKEIEKQIASLNNKQMAVKILMNSLFGAIGNKWYRYFDLRVAEGITLTGQHVIKTCEKAINDEMNKLLDTKDDYVIAIDTDSIYVNFEKFVQKFNPKDPIKFLDESCNKHFGKVLEKTLANLCKEMNCFENRMVMEREVIADRGIWTAKKRYILNVHNSEGVQYDEPKLKIMGIEAIKSSTPEVVDLSLKKYSSLSFSRLKRMYRTSYRNSNKISNHSHPKKWLFHGVSRRLQTGLIGNYLQERYTYSRTRFLII